MPTAWCICDRAAVFRPSTADTMLSARSIALSAICHPTEPHTTRLQMTNPTPALIKPAKATVVLDSHADS